MSDFKTMFPTLSEATIETILRQNGGAVDDTIDQLLVLTMDDSAEQSSPPTAVRDALCVRANIHHTAHCTRNSQQ
jgi:hypothetical protein